MHNAHHNMMHNTHHNMRQNSHQYNEQCTSPYTEGDHVITRVTKKLILTVGTFSYDATLLNSVGVFESKSLNFIE